MKLSKGTAHALHALMHMVRHITQLPLSLAAIAKAEGIPPGQLARVFVKLEAAALVKKVKKRPRGYEFAVDPHLITLLDVFEAIEGKPLFDECLLHHCPCKGNAENCLIYAQWLEAAQKMKQVFAQTSLANAAWTHPEHRFESPP